MPAFQFYPGDWRRDPGVQALDLEHKGAWLEVLCMMHFSPSRGTLLYPSGEVMDDEAIARNLGIPEAHWKQIRSKLVRTGVASEDDDGALVNRRMAKDERTRRARAEAGRKGGQASKPQAKEKPGTPPAVAVASADARITDNSVLSEPGPSPDVENPETWETEPPEKPLDRVMGGLRKLGYDMGKTTGSVAKAMLAGGCTPDEILIWAEGQVILAGQGQWDMTPPWPILPLWSKKLNTDCRGASWQRECENAYYRQLNRRGRAA